MKRYFVGPAFISLTVEGHGFQPCRKRRWIRARAAMARLSRHPRLAEKRWLGVQAQALKARKEGADGTAEAVPFHGCS